MKRYVDADKMLERTKAMKSVYEAITIDGIVKYIENNIEGDVHRVRHGENVTKMHPTDEFICSECGLIMRDFEEIRVDDENDDECYYEFEFKYCPHCGAKMDRKDGE